MGGSLRLSSQGRRKSRMDSMRMFSGKERLIGGRSAIGAMFPGENASKDEQSCTETHMQHEPHMPGSSRCTVE